MDYLKKSFNSRPSNEAYRIGWEKAFGKNTLPVSDKWCPHYYKNGRHCRWADLYVTCNGQHKDCPLTETQLEIKAKRKE